MPTAPDFHSSIADGFAEAVAAWDVFGLPALVAAVVFAVAWLHRGREGEGGRLVAVRRLGVIHLGLAVWSVVRVVEEVRAHRVMGIYPSNPVSGLPGSLLAVAVDVPVGLALWRLWSWGRGAGLSVEGFRTVLAVAVAAWSVQYGAAFAASDWPHQALTKALPAFALATLSLPATRRAFRARHSSEVQPPAPTPLRSEALALAALGFLVVVGSVVVTDALDVAARAWAETPR